MACNGILTSPPPKKKEYGNPNPVLKLFTLPSTGNNKI